MMMMVMMIVMVEVVVMIVMMMIIIIMMVMVMAMVMTMMLMMMQIVRHLLRMVINSTENVWPILTSKWSCVTPSRTKCCVAMWSVTDSSSFGLDKELMHMSRPFMTRTTCAWNPGLASSFTFSLVNKLFASGTTRKSLNKPSNECLVVSIGAWES